MNETLSTIVGVLILLGSVAYVTSHRYRVQHAWKKAIEALEAGNTDSARKYLQKCVRQAPSLALARRLLGRTLVAQRRYEEAEKQIRLAAQLEPRNAEGHLELAVFLSNCPPVRMEEAAESLARAIEFEPRLKERLDTIPQLAALRDHPAYGQIARLSTKP